jgi:hypothetical protein
MARTGRDRGFWWGMLVALIAAGLLSRSVPTGFRLFDKYLGDALYAVMVYVLIRLGGGTQRVALWAAFAMVAIECFQLTGIPAGMLRSEHWIVRMAARLLGTQFSFLDLFAYAAGIAGAALADRRIERRLRA